MTEYAPGVPMWIDVSTPDLEKSRAFYGGLFGWDSQVVGDASMANYTDFNLNGKSVAAVHSTMSPEEPSAWATYVCSADAAATSEAAQAAGGTVVAPPMQVMEHGTMAVLRDPTGAYICLWQPAAHRGADLVNEPGSFCWNELYTRDMPAAREFYQKAFNWSSEETDFAGGKYTLFQVDGKPIAGGLDMSAMLPESVPPHWLVYFTVANTAESVARATELGATILHGPDDTPMGAMAVIQDPVGAVFAIIQSGQQSE